MLKIRNLFTGKWAAIAGAVFLIAADYLSKCLAVRYLKDAQDVILIPGIFQLSYLENRGAAWGLFGGMRWLFVIATILIIAAVCFVWRRMPETGHYWMLRILCILFVSGAAGNAIDRLFHGYVIDFFYFSLIDFPIFNVADCYVCISVILALIIYRNEDFTWMSRKS